jgi:transposase
MDDPTSLLLGLESFRVVDVVRVEDRVVQVVIETVAPQALCPDCGTESARVKDRPLARIRDLPVADQQVALWWRKRRLVCSQRSCPRMSFTQATTEIPPRSRLTARLRQRLAEAVARSNRAVSEVAAEYGVAWRTAHRALVAAAATWLGAPASTRVLGIDETRTRTVRWILAEQGWRRTDPWMTSFVDADTTRPGLLLGLAPGRSGGCVRTWLAEQSTAFRAGIELVVIDPSAPYASGIRTALPHARIAVDHWHLVRLANDMLTEVRQRVTRQLHRRRGLVSDPVWAHRRMLLTAGDRLSRRQLDRLTRVLDGDDPTGEIGAAWGCKELLRQLLAEHEPARIRAAPCGASTTPARKRTYARPPVWPTPSRPGGRPSSSP